MIAIKVNSNLEENPPKNKGNHYNLAILLGNPPKPTHPSTIFQISEPPRKDCGIWSHCADLGCLAESKRGGQSEIGAPATKKTGHPWVSRFLLLVYTLHITESFP